MVATTTIGLTLVRMLRRSGNGSSWLRNCILFCSILLPSSNAINKTRRGFTLMPPSATPPCATASAIDAANHDFPIFGEPARIPNPSAIRLGTCSTNGSNTISSRSAAEIKPSRRLGSVSGIRAAVHVVPVHVYAVGGGLGQAPRNVFHDLGDSAVLTVMGQPVVMAGRNDGYFDVVFCQTPVVDERAQIIDSIAGRIVAHTFTNP